MDIVDIFRKGGPVMWPLLALSILALSVVIERLWFWVRILNQEREVVERVLDAAQEDWETAAQRARKATNQPIGRFLNAPLRLAKPDPEVFRLALEATAEDELASMRRGEKVLEAIIALAPLLGLLGTVVGLIHAIGSIRLGDLGTSSSANVTLGIGESLICTATGLLIAIFAMTFYRLFQGFLVNQVKVFRRAGSDLELLYRQSWPNVPVSVTPHEAASEGFISPRKKGKSKRSESSAPSETVTDEGFIVPRSENNKDSDKSEF